MPTIAFDVLEWLDEHPDTSCTEKTRLLSEIPAAQWDSGHWLELSKHCGNRVEVHQEPRFMNRLSIYTRQPPPRCLFLSPDGRGLAWLLSGGEVEAYGQCERLNCERTHQSNRNAKR